MVDWLAGNRVRGTSTERTSTTGFNNTPAISGGWKEVARTTLGSNNANINVSSIPDKRYYMILSDITLTGAGTGGGARLGSGSVDSTANYAQRWSANGAADGASGGYSNYHSVGGYSNSDEFYVTYIANKSDKEKLIQTHRVYGLGGGAGNDPKRAEYVSKWVNTSNPLDYINYYQGGSDQYANGSEIVVLGWDDTDTHTTNFWEELATNTASGGGSTQEVTFTAKKYLWFQCYFELSGSTDIPRFQVGNGSFDTGNNYAERFSGNGGADETQTSRSDIHIDKASSKPFFVNGFIINNASQEKLFIIHSTEQNTAGAGNAPTRIENVGKWTNTSNQIDRLRITFGTDTINAGAIMKVWGHD